MLKIIWKKDEVEIESKNDGFKVETVVEGNMTLTTLVIDRVSTSDAGRFQIVAENEFGVVDSIISLIVKGKGDATKVVDLKAGLKKSTVEYVRLLL